MFEPRGADIPILFLVLVVLPLVAYILLGKWSEAAKKRERISLLAQVAAEEALKAEAMAAGNAIRLMSSSTSGLHMCARCFAPATTRCARCKSVRYCSGKCQIIHWRKVHRQECEQLETSSSSSSVKTVSVEESLHERVSLNDRMNSQFLGYKINAVEKVTSDDTTYPSLSIDISAAADCSAIGASKIPSLERTMDNLFSRKSHSEMFTGEDKDVYYKEEQSKTRGTPSIPFNIISSKEAFMRNRSRNSDSVPSEVESPRNRNFNGSNGYVHGQATAGSTMHKSDRYKSQHGSMFEPRNTCGFSTSSYLRRDGNAPDTREEYDPYGKQKLENNFDTGYFNCSSEMTATTESIKAESGSYSVQTKIYSLPKSRMQVSGEQYGAVAERKGQLSSESKHGRARDILAVQGSDGVAKMGSIKMLGLRKPSESTECTRKDAPITNGKRHKKSKMLFPYEEFLEFFQCEVYDLSPRGLLNCGNSCYANAILQCLTCTKPLIIYLLRRLHSRACCGKDWCLMCELEQHVMMLTESGGPLSPSRILLHIQSINSQIGDGSQEDAHEFLRFLIASMQSICLEGLGGENKVDPRLQETTFIQHVFGGLLRSKVKCMLCQHESERYENIMDLTLEIFGWVESLEDALTQFTTAEDLDGENMYRCGRCAAYVRARKQLSIHEAPNILTIVLKRFQEGKYGKINKWITFPEMLDMIPFMTGTGDIPPLYMLYAVVVHLDSLNASFSGHYVSYIKDMEGNWFRIDDIEVQPVSMSQVMSEGAYILFYMRSCPRPQRTYTDKAVLRKGPDCAKYCISKTRQVPDSAKYCVSKTQKPAKPEEIRPSSHYVGLESSTAPKPDVASSSTMHTSNGTLRRSTSRNVLPVMGACTKPVCLKFSDAMSSDWSLFTSSDEASFTTESTRDSFSTVDYADTWNMDTVSSIFDISNAPRYCGNSAAHRQFSIHRPRVRFLSEQKSHILDSYLSTQPLNKSQKQEFSNQLADPSNEFSSESHRCTSVKYGSNPIHGLDRTSCHCKV